MSERVVLNTPRYVGRGKFTWTHGSGYLLTPHEGRLRDCLDPVCISVVNGFKPWEKEGTHHAR